MKDKLGREYAKLSALKAGDKVQVDGGFTCLKPWSIHKIKKSKDGLYIPCSGGHHYLDGQADDGVNCIGVYPV